MTDAHQKPDWAQSRHEKKNAERVAQGMKPKRRILPWIVLAVIIAAIAAFFLLQPPAPAGPAETAELAPIVRQIRQTETATLAPVTLRNTVKVTGVLEPAQRSEVASQASGRVIAVLVRPGDRVNEGDVLAQIDRESLALQLSQQRATADATRAQLESSEQQLERTEQLASQGLATPSTLEQARSSTAALRANLSALESATQTAELSLNNATVRSPLTGVVAARSVDPGQSVAAGTALFTVVNLDDMIFEAAASVNSSALVAPGQAVTVGVTGLNNMEFPGEVQRVNPVALAGTRTVPIYISVENTEGQLRGGMFATGQITVTQKEGAIAVPAAALREDAEGQYVLKLEGEALVRQGVEVVTEWDRGQSVEVSGLSEGDVIVSAPLAELAPGEPFELVEG